MASGGDRAGRPGYEELQALVVEQAAQIAQMRAESVELWARMAEQAARIAELQAKLKQNSRNSSKPPSSDGYGKPSPKRRSLRRSSGRKPGGQSGAEGHHLARVEVPDERITHEPDACDGCGSDLSDAEELESEESRQVFDIPEELALEVIEHVAKLRRCGSCGRVNQGRFPEGVRAPAQYGSRLRGAGGLPHRLSAPAIRPRVQAAGRPCAC